MTLNSAPFKIRNLFNLNRYGVKPLNLCLCVVSFPAAVGKRRRFRLSLEMFTTEHRLQTDLQFMQRCTFLIGVYYWTKTSGHLNNGKGRALLSNQRVISTFSTGGEDVCTSRRTSLERTMHQPALLSASPHICYIYVPQHKWKEAMWQKRNLKDGIYVQPWSITSASLPGMLNLSCVSMFTNSPTRDLRSVMHIRFCNRCESDVEKFTGEHKTFQQTAATIAYCCCYGAPCCHLVVVVCVSNQPELLSGATRASGCGGCAEKGWKAAGFPLLWWDSTLTLLYTHTLRVVGGLCQPPPRGRAYPSTPRQ